MLVTVSTTQKHFLIGKFNSSSDSFWKTTEAGLHSRKQYRQTQDIFKQFWERLVSEYLSILQTRKKWKTTKENIQPGALALIKKYSIMRSKWPLGRVVQVLPSCYSVVQVVKVKTSTGMYTRQTAKINFLECDEQ